MIFVLFRHATRVRGDMATDEYLELSQPLSAAGEEEARQQGEELLRRGLKPTATFTSRFAHARQTAELLCTTARLEAPTIIELCTLTPHYQGPREWRGE